MKLPRPRSIRARVVIGAVGWGITLTLLSHVFGSMLGRLHPHEIRIAHWTLVALVGVAVIILGLLQVRWSMASFNTLRTALTAVRDGRLRRLEGRFPSEFDPLVNDLNSLLDHRERLVDQALKKAGDLAHGLKTPLALLNQEADSADDAGLHDVADAIRAQVSQMRKQIDYHLARTRAAVSGATPGLKCGVQDSAQGLVRTLERLYAGRELVFSVDISQAHFVKGRSEDLEEVLGNILDNACKWAKSRIAVDARAVEGSIVISVDDDGPGLDPSMWEKVLQRGVRADESAPGSGLGLAIATELIESCGGTICLAASQWGGLRAVVSLPSASE